MEAKKASDHELIMSKLLGFINQHIENAQLISIDEIVLSYVATVLENLVEDLKEESLDECFDVQEFCEMLSAYIPEFASLSHSVVSDWILGLVECLKEKDKEESESKAPIKFENLFCDLDETSGSKQRTKSADYSIEHGLINGDHKRKYGRNGHRSMSESASVDSAFLKVIQDMKISEETKDRYKQALDMFPLMEEKEFKELIAASHGDVDKAIQMALLREQNDVIKQGTKRTLSKGTKESKTDEKAMKDRIIQRYGFIDQAEDSKEFRPLLPKEEPKKLVRYREGQVVSTKGERYTEVRITKNGEQPFKNYISKPHRYH